MILVPLQSPQGVSQEVPRVVHQARRGEEVLQPVVVRQQQGKGRLAEVQGEGRQVALLEGEEVRHSQEARVRVEVVVVDQGRPQDVETVQEGGQGL